MRWLRIGLAFTLAALAISDCRRATTPRARSPVSAASVASEPRLPTREFKLSHDAAVLVDTLAAGEFRPDPGGGDPDPYAQLAPLLTPKQATALLQHDSATVRAYMALHAVLRLGQYDSVRPALRDATRIDDASTDDIRSSSVAEETAAALCYAAATDPRARSFIASVLGDATYRPAWGEAIRCAASRHLPGARERALTLVDDADKEIQASAFYALGDAATDADAPRLLGILDDRNASRRYLAATVLEHLAGPSVVETLERLARTDSDKHARAAEARAYARHAEARKGALQALVADTEELVAIFTADGLAKRGGPNDLALMVPYLLKLDGLYTLDLQDAFRRPTRPEWVAPMRELTAARGSGVREAALQWLGRAHDAASIPLARKALRSSDALDQLGAIGAVADLGDKDSVSLLVALLSHANSNIRLAAARALTVLHAQSAYPKLAQAAQRETSFQRKAMLDASDALREGREVPVDDQ